MVPPEQFITLTWMSAQASPAPRTPATNVQATSAHPRERLAGPAFGSKSIALPPFGIPSLSVAAKRNCLARGTDQGQLSLWNSNFTTGAAAKQRRDLGQTGRRIGDPGAT